MRLLSDRKLICWDFDGVIKDSVDVKTRAFVQLFEPYGSEIAQRVRAHHEEHGGMSRYDKMPLYLGWAGEAQDGAMVEAFCGRFADATLQAVIDAPWVAGVREYLFANYERQYFVLVTATPQSDIEQILEALHLAGCFREVCGAPTPKAEAVGAALRRFGCSADDALVVGDSETDLAAAERHGVPFLLRRTPLNAHLQKRYSGPAFDGLKHE